MTQKTLKKQYETISINLTLSLYMDSYMYIIHFGL